MPAQNIVTLDSRILPTQGTLHHADETAALADARRSREPCTIIGADPKPLTFAGQEPMGFDACELDEAEEDQAGDGHPGFVMGPRPRGEIQGFSQGRPTIFAIL